MKIHVQTLPFDQDFTTEFEVPTESFIPEDKDHPDSNVAFVGPAKCHATLRKMTADEVLLNLQAMAWIEAVCDRCTETYKVPVAVEASLLCKTMTRESKKQDETEEPIIEDEGLVYFSKKEILLDEIVREQILLNMPIQKICDEKCQGLCTACGENLNQGDHFCSKDPYFEYKTKVL